MIVGYHPRAASPGLNSENGRYQDDGPNNNMTADACEAIGANLGAARHRADPFIRKSQRTRSA